MNFVGPEEDSVARAPTRCDGGDAADKCESGAERGEGDGDGDWLYVDAETFCLWLDSSEFSFGYAVQRWWAEHSVSEEGVVDGLKHDEDETSVEFFRRMLEDVRRGVAESALDAAAVKGYAILLPALLELGLMCMQFLFKMQVWQSIDIRL